MRAGEQGQFTPCHGMADQNQALNLQRVEELPNIFYKRAGVVAAVGFLGFAMPAPGESEHTKVVGELRREVVKNMGGVAHSVQEQHRLSLPAPIEIMELHVVDRDESVLVR